MCDAAEFSELNASGFFQVYIALTNFHTFVAQYLSDLQDTCDSLQGNLAAMSQQFKSEFYGDDYRTNANIEAKGRRRLNP